MRVKLPIFFLPEAEEDLLHARKWYEERQIGLGDDFIFQVEAALFSVQENPGAFPLMYKEIRRVLIHRFPYGVFYIVKEAGIFVLAVLHCRRDPKKWRSRSK